ncbi:MAG: lysostaphin resistance A-like protein [Actinomycetota bacterium]
MDGDTLPNAIGTSESYVAGTLIPEINVAIARRWVMGAVLVYLGSQVAGVAVGLLVGLLIGDSGAASAALQGGSGPWWFTLSTAIGQWAGFVGGVIFVVRFTTRQRALPSIGLSFRLIDLAGIAIGLVAQFALSGLTTLLFGQTHTNTTKWTAGFSGGGLTVICLCLIVVVPVVEESLFRGLLGRGLLSMARPSRAYQVWWLVAVALADGLLFGIVHGQMHLLLALALFGALLQLLSMRTGRLGMGVFAHAAFNATAVLPILLAGHA